MDHFTKFHILFPMKSKQAKEVVHGLKERIFSMFSLLYVLHSIEAWPGECKLVNGKARSPWVQGCVEKGNHCVEIMITAKRREKSSNSWVSKH